MRKLLTVEEAAEYTGFTVRYLRRLIFERRLAYHKDRKRIWLAQADLDAYVRSLRIEAREDRCPPSSRSERRLAPGRRSR
jgi:excisionase family DNA binding protein